MAAVGADRDCGLMRLLGKGRAQLWQQGRAAVARGRSWRWLTVHAAQVLFPKTQEGPFTFIPYPSGMGIIYSSDVAEHVARLMGGPLSLRTIWPHDAMSAVRLAGVDVELRDDYRFHDRVGRGTVQGNCTDESLMIHPLHDTEGLPSMHAAVLRVELASAHGAGWAASIKSAFVN